MARAAGGKSWAAVGSSLKELNPIRYRQVLELVRKIEQASRPYRPRPGCR